MINRDKYPKNWALCEYQLLLAYIQPTKYIVENTMYDDNYDTSVLTAGKSFIKGYTNEKSGIFNNLPVVIFDDFTTASKYVNFPFKVKSSAMKILRSSCELVNLKFMFFCMQVNQIRSDTHKRYWISVYAKKKLYLPLLKHVFEGKLTEQWQKDNADNLETADELLVRIQRERESRYQAQLKAWSETVERWVAKDQYGKKPKKPRPVDTSISDNCLPESLLPEGWIWCKVKDLISALTDYHANGSYEVLKKHVVLKDDPDYALMVRATNFEKNNFQTEQKYIGKNAYEFMSKSKLFGGEILIGKIGNAGKVYFMPNLGRKASLAMNLFCLRFSSVSSLYVYYHILSTFTKKQIASYVKGVGNPTIDKKAIRSINIALPSEPEQKQIINCIEFGMSSIDKLDKEINENIDRSEALRQSILKKASSGKLARQDPNDEPASELLKRITAEKAKIDAQLKASKAATKKVKTKSRSKKRAVSKA